MGLFSSLRGGTPPQDDLDPRIRAAAVGQTKEDLGTLRRVSPRLVALLEPGETLWLVAAGVDYERSAVAITERRSLWFAGGLGSTFSVVTLSAGQVGRCGRSRLAMSGGRTPFKYYVHVDWRGTPPAYQDGRPYLAEGMAISRWEHGEASRIIAALQGLRDGWLPDAKTSRPGSLKAEGIGRILLASGAHVTDGNVLRLAQRLGDLIGAQVAEYLAKSGDMAAFQAFLERFEGAHDASYALALPDEIVDWLWEARPIFRRRFATSLEELVASLSEPGCFGDDGQVPRWFDEPATPIFGPTWRAVFEHAQ